MGLDCHEFSARNGTKVMFRPLKREDLEELLEFINTLVDEKANILMTQKPTKDEESIWLERRLLGISKGDIINILAEVDGKIVANSEVERRSGAMSHVGSIGIAISPGYRGIGIGTKIMEKLIEASRKMGLEILILDVFGSNQIAKGLYRKMGFKETGRIPKGIYKNGEYSDLITMTCEL